MPRSEYPSSMRLYLWLNQLQSTAVLFQFCNCHSLLHCCIDFKFLQYWIAAALHFVWGMGCQEVFFFFSVLLPFTRDPACLYHRGDALSIFFPAVDCYCSLLGVRLMLGKIEFSGFLFQPSSWPGPMHLALIIPLTFVEVKDVSPTPIPVMVDLCFVSVSAGPWS